MKLQQTRSSRAVLLGGAGRRAGPQGWTPPSPLLQHPWARSWGRVLLLLPGQRRYQRFHPPPAHPGCHQRVPPACCHVQPQAPRLPAQPWWQDPVEPPRGEGPPAPHQPVRVPWGQGCGVGSGERELGPPTLLLNIPCPGRDQPPASCRCVGMMMWGQQPSAAPGLEDSLCSIVIVGHSCALYPRLPGRDGGTTLPSHDAAQTSAPCGRDAEGRWGGPAGIRPLWPCSCGTAGGSLGDATSLHAGPRGASSLDTRTTSPPARR